MAAIATTGRVCAAAFCTRLRDCSRCNPVAMGRYGRHWYCETRPSKEIITCHKTSERYNEWQMGFTRIDSSSM